jgi:hypothetical protein
MPDLILLVADELFGETFGNALHRRARPLALAPSVGVGLLGMAEAGVPANAIVVHQRALRDFDERLLMGLASMSPRPRLVLLRTAGPQWSMWDDVIPCVSNTASVADDLAQRLDAEADLAPRADLVTIRLGDPWPMIRCTRCGASRHFFKPRGPNEDNQVRAALPKFVLQHRNCAA